MEPFRIASFSLLIALRGNLNRNERQSVRLATLAIEISAGFIPRFLRRASTDFNRRDSRTVQRVRMNPVCRHSAPVLA